MIEWYKSKKIAIYFDDVPCVGIRYKLPSMTKDEKKSIDKYPFICRRTLEVTIFDFIGNHQYKFTIPKDYCYDGASIPRMFWRIVGAPTDNKFLIAALVHDVLCERHEVIMYDKSLSTNVFNALLEVAEVNPISRFLMKNSVACFQTLFCNWDLKIDGERNG